MSRTWSPEDKVDVEHLLEVLEIEKVKSAGFDEWIFACPYEAGHAHGDKNPSAGMNGSTTAWKCHGCGRKGNAITLVSSLLNISPIKARRLLREAYDPSSLDVDSRSMREELRALFTASKNQRIDPANHPIDKKFLDDFATDWRKVQDTVTAQKEYVPEVMEYILERGFSWQTLEDYDFGYDSKSDRLTFAIYDEDGHLVGFKSRGPSDAKPKYLYLGDHPSQLEEGTGRYGFPLCAKSLIVYNAHKATAGEEWIVVEGELNAIALSEYHFDNVVALSGSSISDAQLKILKRASVLTFWFDPDPAGRTGLWGYNDEDGFHHPGALEKLLPYVDIKVIDPPDKRDAADYLADDAVSELDEIIDSSRSYTNTLLRRRLAGLDGK